MYVTSTIPIHRSWRNGSQPRPTTDQALEEADRIVEHFVHGGVLRPESRATRQVRMIFAAPPEALRVSRIARRVYSSRRTLGRYFRAEGLPPAREWVVLARAMLAHRTFVNGGSLQTAAYAAGYSDPFTMSNAFHRITGLRPSQLRDVCWQALLAVWIARQRERGTLTGPPPAEPRACPICGGRRAS